MSDARQVRYFTPEIGEVTAADEVIEQIVDSILLPTFDPRKTTIEGLIVNADPEGAHPDISLELIQSIVKKLHPDLALTERSAAQTTLQEKRSDVQERIRTLIGMKSVGLPLTADNQAELAALKAERLTLHNAIAEARQQRVSRRLSRAEQALEKHFLKYYLDRRQVISLDNDWRELLPTTSSEHERVLQDNLLQEVSRMMSEKHVHHAHVARVFADGDAYTIWYKLENSPTKQVTQIHGLKTNVHSSLREVETVSAPVVSAEFMQDIRREARDLKYQEAEKRLQTDMFSEVNELRKASLVHRLEERSRYHRLANALDEAKRLTQTDKALSARLTAAGVNLDHLMTQKNAIAPLLAQEEKEIEDHIVVIGERLLQESEKLTTAEVTPLPVKHYAELLKLPLMHALTEQSEPALPQAVVLAFKQAFPLDPHLDGADIMEAMSRLHDQAVLLSGINQLLATAKNSSLPALKTFAKHFMDEFNVMAKEQPGYMVSTSLTGPPQIKIDTDFLQRQQAEEQARTMRKLSEASVQVLQTEKAVLVDLMQSAPVSSAMVSALAGPVESIRAEREALTHLRQSHEAMMAAAVGAKKAITSSVLPEFTTMIDAYQQSLAIYKMAGGTALNTEIKEVTAAVSDLQRRLSNEVGVIEGLSDRIAEYKDTQDLKAAMEPSMVAITQYKQAIIDKTSQIIEKTKSAVEQLNCAVTNLHVIYDAIKNIVNNWNRNSRHIAPLKTYFEKAKDAPNDVTIGAELQAITAAFHVPASMKVKKSDFKSAARPVETRLKTATNRFFDLGGRFSRSDRSTDFYVILQNLKELAKDPTLATGIYNAEKTSAILEQLQTFMKIYSDTLKPK